MNTVLMKKAHASIIIIIRTKGSIRVGRSIHVKRLYMRSPIISKLDNENLSLLLLL
jgi:hypothetical protein